MTPPHVAVFVSPHGYGHAARASAVMEALHRRTGAHFELYASVPRWFFDESVPGLYRYHGVSADVGFVQASALKHDVDATVEALSRLVPFHDELVDGLALEVKLSGCTAVLCDIAPLGIAVAEKAGLPSILVENFTWPWLYEPHVAEAPGLEPFARELDRWVGRATLHVLAEPFCRDDPRAHARVLPVSRPARRSREDVRKDLNLPGDRPVVTLTMGGYSEEMPFLDRLRGLDGVTFLVTGCTATETVDNVRCFGRDAHLYMPHVVRASDAVVAKLGYSTVAEVWREGRPLAFISRSDSREMGPLADWVTERLPGFEVPDDAFAQGDWVERIPELLRMERPPSQAEGGADQVVALVRERLSGLFR